MFNKENRNAWIPASMAGAAAGLLNGFFGGGGGMVLVPLLISYCKLPHKKALATSVAIILPLCILSASIYFYHGNLNVVAALPYLFGGLVGGLIGGKLFHRIPVRWLRKIFGLFLLYGAWRFFI